MEEDRTFERKLNPPSSLSIFPNWVGMVPVISFEWKSVGIEGRRVRVGTQCEASHVASLTRPLRTEPRLHLDELAQFRRCVVCAGACAVETWACVRVETPVGVEAERKSIEKM